MSTPTPSKVLRLPIVGSGVTEVRFAGCWIDVSDSCGPKVMAGKLPVDVELLSEGGMLVSCISAQAVGARGRPGAHRVTRLSSLRSWDAWFDVWEVPARGVALAWFLANRGIR